MGVQIIKTGKKVPYKKITNFDLEKILNTTDEWIKDRTGVISRFISTNETTTSLSIEACQDLLKENDVNLSEIGLIICATMTPDTIIPTVSANIKKALKIDHCITFDINVACSGFLYALSIAESMMKNLSIKKGIVVGVDLNSQLVDWKDRGTAIVFGDGAGSVLLSYDINTSISSVINLSKVSLNEIKYIVPHQANQRIIDAAAKNLKISKEKFYINIDNYANTSAGSIPIALDELNKNNLLKKGDYIILVGFGGGLSFGAILLKW